MFMDIRQITHKEFKKIQVVFLFMIFQGLFLTISCTQDDPKVDLDNALVKAVWKHDQQKTKELILEGANINLVCPNNTRCSPFINAIENKDVEIVKLFVDAGVNVNMAEGAFQDTAIIHAVISKDLEITKILLEAGADIYQENRVGISAWQGVCLSGDPDFLKLFIDHGANVRIKFIYKKVKDVTPLMLAASKGPLDSIKFLLKADAEIEAKDSNGETALDYAISKGKIEVADYLKQRLSRLSK
jgi:ankyrin repeat protein